MLWVFQVATADRDLIKPLMCVIIILVFSNHDIELRPHRVKLYRIGCVVDPSAGFLYNCRPA